MDRNTGRAIEGHTHLRQRLSDILSTPLGSRVERRDYGSRLPRLVDRPVTPSLRIDIVQATAEALSRWEFEFRLTNVAVGFETPGHVRLDLTGTDLINGKKLTLEGVTV